MPIDASSPPPPSARAEDRARARSERAELLDHLQALLEPLMVVLGFVFLALLLVDYAGLTLSGRQRVWFERTMTGIWVAFLADFLIRLVVAPSKLRFLRANWLTALSLALPFLRPLRVLRALRAVRSLSLVRLVGGVNRGMRVLRRVTRGRQFAYVGALTVLVVLAGAVGVLFFDRSVDGAPIQTFGDALWWSATMVTTINNEAYAVSAEARVIAVLMRVYAVSVFGFITASIASYLVGREAEARAGPEGGEAVAGLRAELANLRQENVLLRQELSAMRAAVERLASVGATGLRTAHPREVAQPPQAAADDRLLGEATSGIEGDRP